MSSTGDVPMSQAEGMSVTEPLDTAGAERLVGADRVLAVLLELGEHPNGVSLNALAEAIGSPKPTIHRALTALRRAGLARQLSRGQYTLGDEFIRMALRTVAERPDSVRVGPILARLADRYSETAHFAVLEGTEVIYRAKMDPPRGAVRLTSVVGGRNPAYCTAVGKLMLSQSVRSLQELEALLGDAPLPRRTGRTICDVGALWRELEVTRERGYAVDDQENEEGVNCIAVPFGSDPLSPESGAVSVSALAFRLPLESLVADVGDIIAIVQDRDPEH